MITRVDAHSSCSNRKGSNLLFRSILAQPTHQSESQSYTGATQRLHTWKRLSFGVTLGFEWVNGLRQDPPWFEFLVIFDFFAPWYKTSREASSVKIS